MEYVGEKLDPVIDAFLRGAEQVGEPFYAFADGDGRSPSYASVSRSDFELLKRGVVPPSVTIMNTVDQKRYG